MALDWQPILPLRQADRRVEPGVIDLTFDDIVGSAAEAFATVGADASGRLLGRSVAPQAWVSGAPPAKKRCMSFWEMCVDADVDPVTMELLPMSMASGSQEAPPLQEYAIDGAADGFADGDGDADGFADGAGDVVEAEVQVSDQGPQAEVQVPGQGSQAEVQVPDQGWWAPSFACGPSSSYNNSGISHNSPGITSQCADEDYNEEMKWLMELITSHKIASCSYVEKLASQTLRIGNPIDLADVLVGDVAHNAFNDLCEIADTLVVQAAVTETLADANAGRGLDDNAPTLVVANEALHANEALVVSDRQHGDRHYGGDACIRMELPLAVADSKEKVYERSLDMVKHILRNMHLPIFKIGITSAPQHRMRNPRYGYLKDGFKTMHLLHAGRPDEVARLEQSLIDAFQGMPGNYNIAKGGEGIHLLSADGLNFTYVVTTTSDDLTAFRRGKNKHAISLYYIMLYYIILYYLILYCIIYNNILYHDAPAPGSRAIATVFSKGLPGSG